MTAIPRTSAARIAVIASMALAPAGCLHLAQAPPEAAAPPPLDAAEAMLTEAALRAQTALSRLARVEADPSAGAEIPRMVPEGLLRRVDLSWTGPLHELVRVLAADAGFALETAGAAPARPVMVDIRAERRPLVMVFRDAGLQAGAAAALTVDADRRLVVLDWTGGGR